MPTLCRARRLESLATLVFLTAFPLAIGAQEKRGPADFYIPTSAHFELDVAVSIDVAGLEEIKTVDDVLAFRERVVANGFSREDLLSWKILGAMGLTKIEREPSPPPPAPRGAIVGPVRRLPEWRDVVVDLDAESYAYRSSCEGYRRLTIDTPRAHLEVSFGYGGSVTVVDHQNPSAGTNVRRSDVETILLRSKKRFSGEWETLRADASGTLFRKTIVLDRDRGVVEDYLLADPLIDEVRMWAFVGNGRLIRFQLALQSLPAETSSECVVPEIVLSFEHGAKQRRLEARRLKKAELDTVPRLDVFAYPLQVGDHYQAHTHNEGLVAETITFGGLDVASVSPGVGLELVRARMKRP